MVVATKKEILSWQQNKAGSLYLIHGYLSALFCCVPATEAKSWFAQLMCNSIIPEDTRENPDDSMPHMLESLVQHTALSAEDQDRLWWMLLPEENTPLGQQTQALTEWCCGFIDGCAAHWPDPRVSLQDDEQEMLGDLQTITHLNTNEEDEDAMNHLVEVIEYTRLAVRSLFYALQAYSSTDP